MPGPVVLTLCDYYLPGYKAGGPITTVTNMVAQLGREFEFRVVARNHDLGESEPYPGVASNSWQEIDGTSVCHLSSGRQGRQMLRSLLNATPHAVLYLNSFFSPLFSILPLTLRRLGIIPRRPVVLAPRGELCDGALDLKRTKKELFLRTAKAAGLHHDIVWQASTEQEAKEIRHWFGARARVHVAANLARLRNPQSNGTPIREKQSGSLRVLFLSRVAAKKNLHMALDLLRTVRGRMEFDIVGPLEDRAYWRRCQDLIRQLPSTITVTYHGAVRPHQVPEVMREYELFLLPTLGENFGHVILEALSAACPVLISDRTAWTNLERQGAGWDLPLDRPDLFQSVLQQCIDMNAVEHASLRRGAAAVAREFYSRDSAVLQQNRALFLAACGRSSSEPAPQIHEADRAAA